MRLDEVGDGVYACVSDHAASRRSNSGLVNAGEGLVIDTQFDLAHAQCMLELFGRVWRRPAGRVVNTHAHPGHTWGNRLFSNSEIIAYHAPAPEAPKTRPYETERLRLDDTDVHLVHVGPCHSLADTLVHLPAESVVCAGDVVCKDLTPIVNGSFENWLSVLDWILEIDPEVIVPGHGPLCGIEGVMDQKAYLAHVWFESQRHFNAGRTALETARRVDLGAFAAWSEPERLYLNVEQAFRELSGLRARGHASKTHLGPRELSQSGRDETGKE